MGTLETYRYEESRVPPRWLREELDRVAASVKQDKRDDRESGECDADNADVEEPRVRSAPFHHPSRPEQASAIATMTIP